MTAVTCAVEFTDDATEQGERQIREAADLLNALIESSADAIFVKDREGRYMLANSTFARVLGQDRAALVGNRDTELMSPERCAEIRDIHADILASARPYVGDLTVPAYDTAHMGPRILQTIYAPIRAPAGPVIAVAGISRDVTDERRAAADLRLAKERAEAADESKTRFLAAASHDLRQPVQAAILFAGLIHAHATGDLQKPAEQLRLVLNDLRSMLDSLFDVSRYDTQSMRAEIVAFPLQPLIDQTIAALAGQAGAKGLVIGAQPSGIWVRSDHALLGRMLGNIVQNAVRYTALGSIRIDVSIVQDIDVSIVQDSVHIAVTDTGPGIAQADMARIWQEFEQLHNQGRDRRQGLGLGLAIVRRLSRILGHHVAVTSQPGQGTTFTITLPRAEPVTIPPAGVPSHGAHMAQARSVIVVEDDPALLTVLDMLLQDNGWHVIAAACTADALSLLNTAQHAPDVILTDYRLQGGALGTAAITAIRARFGRAIPAIILTGDVGNGTKGTDDPLADSYGLGDVSVLRKPIAAAELAAAMHRAMAVDAAS